MRERIIYNTKNILRKAADIQISWAIVTGTAVSAEWVFVGISTIIPQTLGLFSYITSRIASTSTAIIIGAITRHLLSNVTDYFIGRPDALVQIAQLEAELQCLRQVTNISIQLNSPAPATPIVSSRRGRSPATNKRGKTPAPQITNSPREEILGAVEAANEIMRDGEEIAIIAGREAAEKASEGLLDKVVNFLSPPASKRTIATLAKTRQRPYDFRASTIRKPAGIFSRLMSGEGLEDQAKQGEMDMTIYRDFPNTPAAALKSSYIPFIDEKDGDEDILPPKLQEDNGAGTGLQLNQAPTVPTKKQAEGTKAAPKAGRLSTLSTSSNIPRPTAKGGVRNSLITSTTTAIASSARGRASSGVGPKAPPTRFR